MSVDLEAGRRLQAWLESERPPSVTGIAREARCSRQFVHMVLAGKSKPSPKLISACERLGVPTAVIFGDQREKAAA